MDSGYKPALCQESGHVLCHDIHKKDGRKKGSTPQGLL
jgi:hypothetical protein